MFTLLKEDIIGWHQEIKNKLQNIWNRIPPNIDVTKLTALSDQITNLITAAEGLVNCSGSSGGGYTLGSTNIPAFNNFGINLSGTLAGDLLNYLGAAKDGGKIVFDYAEVDGSQDGKFTYIIGGIEYYFTRDGDNITVEIGNNSAVTIGKVLAKLGTSSIKNLAEDFHKYVSAGKDGIKALKEEIFEETDEGSWSKAEALIAEGLAALQNVLEYYFTTGTATGWMVQT
jgi:hypothetical protein